MLPIKSNEPEQTYWNFKKCVPPPEKGKYLNEIYIIKLSPLANPVQEVSSFSLKNEEFCTAFWKENHGYVFIYFFLRGYCVQPIVLEI